jgi:hypothetical protein
MGFGNMEMDKAHAKTHPPAGTQKAMPQEGGAEEGPVEESVKQHGPVSHIEMHSHHKDGHVHKSVHHHADSAHQHVDAAMGGQQQQEPEPAPMGGAKPSFNAVPMAQ